MPSLAEVVTALEGRYDPSWAEPWDAVGLVCGDPDATVSTVHFAIDPVEDVAVEATATGAQLLVTHHPLFLGGTSSVAATGPKGRVVHRLITAGVGLFVAHTNADVADPGVSDALADLLGLTELRPLQPAGDPLDKVVTFVPRADADRVIDALAAAGAGEIGDYSRCGFLTEGTGTFLPGPAAHPTLGRSGVVEKVAETRVEMVLRRELRTAVVDALRAAHPYEEPAFDLIELAATAGSRGTGRVGVLPEPTTLAALTARVAGVLPATRWGVRAAGDPDRTVRTVAVCGGSGASYAADAARAGADAYLTADLKHHSTSDTVTEHGLAMIDAAHWATEQPWLRQAASLLAADLTSDGTTVGTTVSSLVTDPWTVHHHQHTEDT